MWLLPEVRWSGDYRSHSGLLRVKFANSSQARATDRDPALALVPQRLQDRALQIIAIQKEI